MRRLGLLLMCALAHAVETGAIEGQPLDADGTPCEGAPITAYGAYGAAAKPPEM